jgi:replicative superfamily II helicase
MAFQSRSHHDGIATAAACARSGSGRAASSFNSHPAAAAAASSHDPVTTGSGTANATFQQDNIALIEVMQLPPHHRHLFSFKNFNLMQSHVFQTAYRTSQNFVVSAPTGCGKTALFELALLRFCNEFHKNSTDAHAFGASKAVYIVPLKALAQEKLSEWRGKFHWLKIVELTSDSDHTQVGQVDTLATADIIITTPERWDSISRAWNRHKKLLDSMRLMLIDEVHLLAEKDRGAVLEGMVSRCKIMHSKRVSRMENKLLIAESSVSQHETTRRSNTIPGLGPDTTLGLNPTIGKFRIVAVSATIPNVYDIADWLDARCFAFGAEFRPVPLTTTV